MSENEPISEQFAKLGREWADAEQAASLLEDCKSSVLAERILACGDMAHNKAEAMVKASLAWKDYVEETVNARHKANVLKVELEAKRMEYGEHQSMAANERLIARM